MHGVVVETEAYLGFDDPASHAYRGRRYRGNQNIYSPPGYWYVYRSYGIHWCANIVTGPPGLGAAVLLRGVLVIKGEAAVRERRGGVPPQRYANGPGKLCQALGIDLAIDGARVLGSPVEFRAGQPVSGIVVTPRIGISKARDWPLRFVAPMKSGAT